MGTCNYFAIGRGHAMALAYVIKNGPKISDKHVGTTGTHRDESNMLHLDGKAQRGKSPGRHFHRPVAGVMSVRRGLQPVVCAR